MIGLALTLIVNSKNIEEKIRKVQKSLNISKFYSKNGMSGLIHSNLVIEKVKTLKEVQ